MKRSIKSYDYSRTNYKDINKQITNIGLAKYKSGLKKQLGDMEANNDTEDTGDYTATDPTIPVPVSKSSTYVKSSVINAAPKISMNNSSLISEFINTTRYLNDEVMVIMSDLNIQGKHVFFGSGIDDDSGNDDDEEDDNDDGDIIDDGTPIDEDKIQQLIASLDQQYTLDDKYDILNELIQLLGDKLHAVKRENNYKTSNSDVRAAQAEYNKYYKMFQKVEDQVREQGNQSDQESDDEQEHDSDDDE